MTTDELEPQAVKKVSVNADALRMVLLALIGPAHQIRELQVLRGSPVMPENPIDLLVREFNEQVASDGSKP